MSDPLEDLLLPSAANNGGRNRKSAPTAFSVLREIEPSELPSIADAPPEGAQGPRILQIRESHHAAARALAEGLSLFEASVITGYAPAYLSGLKQDPAFSELIEFYVEQGKQARADIMERLRVLGLSATNELLARLEADPESWARRELMELAKLCLHEAGHTKKDTAPAPSLPVALNISFVSGPQERVIEAKANPLQLEPTS